MSFSTEPKKILLVGAGFLGKYFLTRMFEGFETFANENGEISENMLSRTTPFVTIIDKQNPDSLYQFPLLKISRIKNYVNYFWQSMGDTSSLQQRKDT